MESNTKKSPGARVIRFLGRTLPAVAFAAVLAACGGGGGGGGGGRAPAQPCDSETPRGGGDGFALGSCAATSTNVFQPIETTVVVSGVDAYRLTLVFPGDLAGLGGTTDFTAAHKPPTALRNIIGVLEGQAYESPAQGANINPPYVAITDFFQASNFETNTPLESLQFASFGTWEKFAGSGQAGFNEGYLGIWYAQRPGAIEFHPPTLAGTYLGRVSGLVGSGPGEPKAIPGRFGFSAPITLQVAPGGQISSAQLGELTISSQPVGGTLVVEELALHPVVFDPSTAPPGLMTGAVTSTTGGQAGDASISSGSYEARYFGIAGQHGQEIAGRFRFTASNGIVGVASFGAIRQ